MKFYENAIFCWLNLKKKKCCVNALIKYLRLRKSGFFACKNLLDERGGGASS